MKALALEFSSRYVQPLLDLAEENGYSLQALLAEWDTDLRQVRDQTNWVSLRFCEALGDYVAARVGPEVLADRVTRAAFSPRALGFLYPLLRTFGSPRMGYAGLRSITAVLNKINEVQVLSLKRSEALIEYRPIRDEFVERSPIICRLRRAQLAAGPTLWSLPPARVEEVECQLRGDGRCLYRVQWAQRAGFAGLVLGAAAGVGAGLALGGGAALLVPAILAGGLGGRLWDQRRQTTLLKRFNEEQTRALEEAAAAAEKRFLELEKAKAEVDRQVEVRTAQLQHTTAQLTESLGRLEQLGRVKNEFVANVSHELRTPLTLILGPLEDLLATRTTAPAPAVLATMHRNAVRLNELINDLLDLARLQAGQLQLVLGEVDMATLLGEVAERFRPLAEHKQIKLTVEAPGSLPVHADRRRLDFALANLLSNALKFTPAGGSVSARVHPTADGVELTVADTGPGVPPELRDQLFRRFARFDQPDAPGAAGTGIGLALVKELVELHGGRIAVTSAVGQGAAFTVTLPRRAAPPANPAVGAVDVPLPTGPERRPIAPVIEPPAGAGAMTGDRDDAGDLAPTGAPLVLVVEDHDDMRAFIAHVLRRRYQVAEAASGAEALAFLARARADAVLSDVMMPGVDGYELCQRLKADPATCTIPVVLITARHDEHSVVTGLERGADDYVVKPFNAAELLARLDVHLRLRRTMDELVQREKLATLGTLAAGLAHEVRNPLTAIIGGLPRLRRELDGLGVRPEARAMLDLAIESAERVSRLTVDMLELGRPDREGPEHFDVHAGLEAALRLFAHRVPAGVEVRRRFTCRTRVHGHPASLGQVFVNLLDNALRAVGDHGVIEVATSDEPQGTVAITVADSGSGVPPAIATRIFDPFYTTRPAGHGTGLGLHLSRRIVNDHHGQLDLVSTPGWGACFRIRLPITREEPGAP